MEKPGQKIGLKHGSGGRAMRQLIEDVFLSLASPVDGIGLEALDDGAALRLGDRWLVITTDSHVVHPVFFPGGDIGRISVCGTVNDLAMMAPPSPWRSPAPSSWRPASRARTSSASATPSRPPPWRRAPPSSPATPR